MNPHSRPLWWNQVHCLLRRLDAEDFQTIQKQVNSCMDLISADLLAHQSLSPAWTKGKSFLLRQLDNAGITNILKFHVRYTTPLAISLFELADLDGGLAALTQSGALAQMILRDFGTTEQRLRYLDSGSFPHGALCMTESLPGAGSEALNLCGKMSQSMQERQMLLHVEKRGRFTSHMDFADFVLIAVEGDGVSVRGSSLVIAEPGDTGTFERGYPIRKVGHRLSSTTNPTFDLHLPLNRLVGGYSLVDGVILPNLQHRHMLEPAMRRMRSLLATMLASKAITTVFLAQSTSYAGQAEDAAYLWAMGEAATSLSFSAARRNHELDNIPCSDPEKSREAALYSSSAKLFCSTALPPLIGNIQRNSAFDETLHDETLQRNIDAQLEDIYIGPSALQRRLISASMTSQWAHTLLNPGQKAVDRSFFSDSDSAAKSILNKTINLWKMTIIELQHIKDAQGSALFCDARQAVSFAMADRYAALLAVCNLSDDLDSARINPAWPPSFTFVYEDLLAIAVLSTSLQTLQTCEELLFGYQPRFQPSEESLSFLHAVRKEVQIRLSIGTTARYRIATWLQQ